jgi:hypothetical protein
MPAAAAVPVTGTGVVRAGPGVYKGCSIKSTSAGTLRLFDNASAASGPIIAIFELAAGGVATEFAEVFFSNGLFLSAPGVVEGSVRV